MEPMAIVKKLALEDLGLPTGVFLEFIMHTVGLNWRQRYISLRQRVEALDEALVSERAESMLIAINDEAGILRLFETAERQRRALSVASRVWETRQKFSGHLALMNLHPEGYLDESELSKAVLRVSGGIPGYLLESGRYYHFYGARLLDQEEWLDFVGRFLMPCTLVSPRYVGHSINRRYCALRLNSVPPYKPSMPRLISAFG
ncbi:MAG TPA: hypothetical protein VFU43_00955 [Streptosporangiaceae bacterium]|nr:hypothetical protein [Streptosporangiaceae bacterium]